MKRRALTAAVVFAALVAAACSQAQVVEGSTTVPGREADRRSVGSDALPIDGHVEPLTCWAAEREHPAAAAGFVDVTESAGLIEPLTGMKGHAAAWGDLNGDLYPDLVFGTFANRPTEQYRVRGATGPSPDRVLLSTGEGYSIDASFPRPMGRTSGVALADLDRDGDVDIVLARYPRDGERAELPTQVYENRDGMFRLVTASGMPDDLASRSIGVLDFDGDTLLDLFIVGDPVGAESSVMLRNRGGLRFEDVTRAVGIPADITGLGVGVADIDLDGITDLFVGGANRLLLGTPDGEFVEHVDPVFEWQAYTDEDWVAGVAIGDLNRDGLPDLVLGHHYNSTLSRDVSVPIRVYLQHRRNGELGFDDVTQASGVPAFQTKAPHVEIADFDNDGWPDILASASAEEGLVPAILWNEGLTGDVPQFASPPGLGGEHYWVTTPTVDVDRDGRLDLFLVEWEQERPSRLLRNAFAGGNWLEVSIGPEFGGGIGTRVVVYDAATNQMIGSGEIAVTQGYAAGLPGHAHFGLGSVDSVDVQIILPGAEEAVTVAGVDANRHLRYPNGCAS